MALPKHVRTHKASGKFRAVVSRGDGRRWHGPLRKTPAEASKDAELYRAGQGIQSVSVTIGEAFARLLVDLHRSGARPATEQFYRGHFKQLTGPLGWPDTTPLAHIAVADLYDYVERRIASGARPQTVWGKDVFILRRLVRDSHRAGKLPIDTLDGVKRPRTRQTPFRAVTIEQVAKLVRKMRSAPPGRRTAKAARDADLIEFLFGTGLRRSEVARLRVSDIDFDAGTISVDGKTDTRQIPLEGMGLRAAEALCDGRALRDPAFGSVEQVDAAFFRIRDYHKAKGVSPHTLRHGFATDAVRRGVQPFILAALMGHTNPRQTMRYYSTHGDEVRAAMRAIGGGDHAAPSRRRTAASEPLCRSASDCTDRDSSQDDTADSDTRSLPSS